MAPRNPPVTAKTKREEAARRRNEKAVKDPNKMSAKALAEKLKARKALLDSL